VLSFVIGERTGISIPASADALLAAGPEFLTRAFHAFGSLPADNSVVGIFDVEPFSGGNSGHKLRLSVEYAKSDAALDTRLFVKFSRDFADPFRDRRRYELEAEVRLALLSRHPAFPVTVPRAWFADFDSGTGTGFVIYEAIAFGEDGIEPCHVKCMDHELADPLKYYRATVTALARLVAAHKSGALAPLADELFPFDLPTALADLPIPLSEDQLREKVATYGALARQCPRLFSENIRSEAFIARLERDAVRILRHQDDVRRFLYGDPDFYALAHWNTNIDNAWFFRGAEGALRCGLLDWGMVRQMNVMLALWGGLSVSQTSMLREHLDELQELYAREIETHGGPCLDRGLMRLHFDLSLALVGLSMMIDVAQLISSRVPEAAEVSGLNDPRILADTVVHGFLSCSLNFLDLWERHDFGVALDHVLADRPERERERAPR
jgi:hypothetical protein